MLLLRLYSAVTALARPLLMRKLRRRAQAEPLYLHATHQRFAKYTEEERAQAATYAGQWVWVHAVSLGETRAASILLDVLREAVPDVRIVLTHGTATGLEEGRKLLRPGDMQLWQPWDSRAATQGFIRTVRPRLGLIMETEIWPNLLQACHQAHVPVALVNARMSEKTLQQSLQLQQMAAHIYGLLSVAYAQTQQDAQRLQQLTNVRVVVTGNLKFDAKPDAQQLAQAQQWRQGLHKPVVTLASSREGEEAMWLQAVQTLPAAQRNAVHWLIVPRHPQRFDGVEALLQQAGIQVARRSHWAGQPPTARDTIWLGDSMGEMALYYGLSSVVLMGGSFAPFGGQNLIEACACACPVLLGEHTFNFAQASEDAVQEQAAVRVASMQAAVETALQIAQNPQRLQTLQRNAQAYAQRHQGAAKRMVQDMQQQGWIT